MADDTDVSIKISASVGTFNTDIKAASDTAKTALDGIRISAEQARQGFAEFGNDLSKLSPAMLGVSTGAAQTVAAVEGLAPAASKAVGGLREIGTVAKEGHLSLSTLVMEARALADEFSSGRLHQAVGTLVRTFATIASANPIWGAMIAAIGATTAALGYAIYQAYEAQKAFSEFRTAADLSDLSVTAAQIESIQKQLRDLTGASNSAAGEITSAFAGMRNGSEPVIRALSLATQNFADMVGLEAPKAAEFLKKAFDDPAKSGHQLIDVLTGLSAEQRRQIETAIQSGSVTAAQSSMYQALRETLQRHVTTLRDEAIAQAQAAAAMDAAQIAITDTAGAEQFIANAVQQATAKFDAQIGAVNGLVQALSNVGPTSRQVADEVANFTAKFNPVPLKIEEINSQIAEMQRLSVDSTGDIGSKLATDMEKAKEQVQALQDQMAGGSILDRTRTDIDQMRATYTGAVADELRGEQAKWEAIVNGENVTAKQREEARRNLAQVTKQLGEDEYRVAEARLSANEAAEKQGSSARQAIIRQEMDLAKSRYGEDSTEYLNLQRRLNEAAMAGSRSRITAASTEARATIQAQRQAALDEIDTKEAEVRQSAQLRQIGAQQELQQLLALEQQREEIERRYVTSKATSAAQMELITAQSAKRRQAIEMEVDKQIVNDTKRTYEQIAQSMSGDLTGLLTKTQTFAGAAQNILKQMLQTIISARLKSVADWLAGDRALDASAGTSAAVQATSAATGAAAASGVRSTSIIESILASAKETFAGIFGFLSPVMGPAAVGPAVAGEAAVGAVASDIPSLAVGTWGLPSDSLVQAHAGETIIPAFESGQFRSAMAALDGGQGGTSGDTHVHFNVQAMDGRSVMQVLRQNADEITKMVSGRQSQIGLRPNYGRG